jgi:cytidylate kinase
VRKFAVAIDGPAGAGKSTAARGLAEELGLTYVDTGAMYRAVAWKAIRAGLRDPDALSRLASRTKIQFRKTRAGRRILADGLDVTDAIRSPEVSQGASLVAVVPGVRRALVRRQRAMARAGGVVMEGRDIGTVVLPDADFKFFIDASVKERARRRWEEMRGGSVRAALKDVERDILRRDRRDRGRKDSPLRPADDAVVVDTTKNRAAQTLSVLLKSIRLGREGVRAR